MAVPIHYGNSITGLYTDFSQSVGELVNAVAKLAVGESVLVPVDDLLLRVVNDRTEKQVLDDQGVIIG